MPRGPNLLFVGPPGTGKSFAADHLLAPIPRAIVADPAHQMDDADFISEDYAQVVEWVKAQPEGSWWRAVWYAPRRAEWGPALEALAKAAEATPGEVVLFVDELGAIRDEGGVAVLRDLTATARLGRHNSVRVWAASQRLTDVPPALITQSDKMLLFGVAGPRDHERVKRELDTSEDGAMLPTVMGLDPYHYVEWDCRTAHWTTKPPVGA